MNIEIKNPKITIVRPRNGSDHVLIFDGERKSGCWPRTEPLTYKLEVARDHGETWCAENFPGVPVELVTGG